MGLRTALSLYYLHKKQSVATGIPFFRVWSTCFSACRCYLGGLQFSLPILRAASAHPQCRLTVRYRQPRQRLRSYRCSWLEDFILRLPSSCQVNEQDRTAIATLRFADCCSQRNQFKVRERVDMPNVDEKATFWQNGEGTWLLTSGYVTWFSLE